MTELNGNPVYHEKIGKPYVCYGCGWKSLEKRTKSGQFLCNECLKIWEGGKFYPRPEAKEPSCIYISDVIPAPEIQSCLIHEPVPSRITELHSCITKSPEYPGEKLKWQKSKILLQICFYYIKKMLLITRLFYDNSQKNSE